MSMTKGWIRMVNFGDLISTEYTGKSMGKLTFVGILRIVSETISVPWNDDTKRAYARDYNKRIIPCFIPAKPMQDYSKEDINEILRAISMGNNYSTTTLNHFRYLISIVYKAGVELNLYEDRLQWGSLSDQGEEGAKGRNKGHLIKKSFSIDEEKEWLEWFKKLDPRTVTGAELGIAFMFFFGLRNQEACGLNYGAIKIITEHRIPCLYIFQTTKVGSSDLKMGGKTTNALRIIPMHDFFYAFMKERIEFLEEQISGGKIKDVQRVDDLPIVCNKVKYDMRGKSNDLTRYGRWLLDSMNMGALLRETGKMIMREAMEGIDIGEKDPTTYIFRRNFATHLSILGLTSEEIQYLIGHNIEKIGEERSHYSSDEKLIEIKRKLESHPYRLILSDWMSECRLVDAEGYRNNLRSHEIIRISPTIQEKHIHIQIDAFEPYDDISINTLIEIPKKSVVLGSGNIGNNPTGNVNIRRQMEEYYRKNM